MPVKLIVAVCPSRHNVMIAVAGTEAIDQAIADLVEIVECPDEPIPPICLCCAAPAGTWFYKVLDQVYTNPFEAMSKVGPLQVAQVERARVRHLN